MPTSHLTVRSNTPAFAVVALMCALFTLDAAAECPAAEEGTHAIESAVIRVATLNIAHGRKDGRNQMLLREQTIRNNLVEVAGLMDRSEADVIALQEVDAESRWSGTFNHLDYLSENSAYACTYPRMWRMTKNHAPESSFGAHVPYISGLQK